MSRRWLIEKTFGWAKQTGPIGRVKVRGLHHVEAIYVFGCAALNLLRLPRLMAQQLMQHPTQQCA